MRGRKHEITPEQRRWLIEHYADTSNAECLEHIGFEPNAGRSLRRIAVSLGLEKSREFMAKAQRNATDHATIMNRGEGNRGKENLLKYGKATRFKKGTNSLQRLGAEREAARLKKSHESRNETIRKERIRISWGFDQKTRMRLVREPRERTTLRHSLRQKGYIVPHRGATTVFYDSNTRRSSLVEERAAKRGFIIQKQP